MPIYRGPGGAGDATQDAASEASLIQDLTAQAQVQANNAAASATDALASKNAAATSATNAATSATNAANSASSASTSATNAASSASTATTKASQAATSATNAATSETNANASAELAQDWATKTSGPVAGGEYSAKYNAQQAAISESNASSSASSASTSAINAANSASAASTSASSASTSATNSANSATSASGSASSASSSASSAASSASDAATSATSAAGSATTATTQAGIATTQASNAATSATAAAGSATTASTQATNAANSASAAATSASNAASSATSAATSATNAANSYSIFHNQYQGSYSTAPTTRPDSSALQTGDLYFNSSSGSMKVWSGSAWLDSYASLSGALLATNNLSDLNNVATARTNLGLGTAATVNDNTLVHLAGTETISGAKTFSTAPTVAGLSNSGNLTFTGTGNRITGDFNNSTFANRTLFQGSVTNGGSALGVIPNGTSPSSSLQLFNNSDPTNASRAIFSTSASDVQINSTITGTGTYLPLTMYTGGSERLRIDTSGNVGIGTSNPNAALDVTVSSGQNLALTKAGGAYLSFYEGSTLRATINGLNTADGLAFTTGSGFTERMRIDSSGNVGIGNTPSYKLDVTGSTFRLYNDSATILLQRPSNSRSGQVLVRDSSGALKYYAGTNGSGEASNVAHEFVSDAPTTGVVNAQINAYGIGLGANTPSSGLGIKFPANQSASSDANTLDDYEEGTFTPSLAFGGSSVGITYNASYRLFSYTKIGKLVTITGILFLSNKGSSTGDATITGLPFPTASGVTGYGGFGAYYEALSYTGYPQMRYDSNGTNLQFSNIVESSTFSTLTNTSFNNNTQIRLCFSYVTN